MSSDKLNILAVSGSPRKVSNTDRIIRAVLRGAEKAGHFTEFIKLNDIDLSPCQACNYCREARGNWCKLKDDGARVLEKTRACDVLIFGSPVYMSGVSAQAKAYLDRWYSFKDAGKITKLEPDRRVLGVYAQGAKDGTYHRLFEANERLFNTNNFEYIGTIVAPDYYVPQEGDYILEKAFYTGMNL